MYLFPNTLSSSDSHVYIYIPPFLQGNDGTCGPAKRSLEIRVTPTRNKPRPVRKFARRLCEHSFVARTPSLPLTHLSVRDCSELFDTRCSGPPFPDSSHDFPGDLNYHLVKSMYLVRLICPQKSIQSLHALTSVNPFRQSPAFLPSLSTFWFEVTQK